MLNNDILRAFINAVKSENKSSVDDVMMALHRMGSDVVPGLANALTDLEPDVRDFALQGLREIGTPQAMEIIAAWEPEDLHVMLAEWVEQNHFDGIPPLPKEVQNLVKDAQRLPKLVIYSETRKI